MFCAIALIEVAMAIKAYAVFLVIILPPKAAIICMDFDLSLTFVTHTYEARPYLIEPEDARP